MKLHTLALPCGGVLVLTLHYVNPVNLQGDERALVFAIADLIAEYRRKHPPKVFKEDPK